MAKTLPRRPSVTATPSLEPSLSSDEALAVKDLTTIPVDPDALFESIEDAKDSAGVYLEELRSVKDDDNDTPYWRGYRHAVEVYRGLVQDLVQSTEQITLQDTIKVRDMLTRYLADNVYLDTSFGGTECYEHGMHDSLLVCGKRLEETIESIATAA